MTEEDISRNLWQILKSLENLNDDSRWKAHKTKIVSLLSDYWDFHPHSAMEMLAVIATKCPFSILGSIVREVVTNWRAKPTYSWSEGGSADHCFLYALIVSDNSDLAEPQLMAKCKGNMKYYAQDSQSKITRDWLIKKNLLLQTMAIS